MSNPLVAGPVEMSTPFTGAFILESGEALCTAIQNGDWVSGGLAGFSAVMDTISMVIDPLGSLIAMGLGWILEHIEPIKGWFNDLTGDAGEVAGFAQTWANVAAHLKTTGEDLMVSMRKIEGLNGQTIDAYRLMNGDAARHIEASGRWADGISAGMQIASMIVKAVHDLTRDAISTIVGTAISATVTTVATVGFGAPVAVAQVTSKVASLVGRIGSFLTRLLRSIGDLSSLVKRLTGLFDELGSAFGRSVPGAPAPRPTVGTTGPVSTGARPPSPTPGLGPTAPRPKPRPDRFDPDLSYGSGDRLSPGTPPRDPLADTYRPGSESGWAGYRPGGNPATRDDWVSYQSQVAGVDVRPDGRLPEWVQVNPVTGDPVKFDAPGTSGQPPHPILIDAKSGHRWTAFISPEALATSPRVDGMVDQALRQIDAADGIPIQWHVSDDYGASGIRQILTDAGIDPDDLTVVYTPRR